MTLRDLPDPGLQTEIDEAFEEAAKRDITILPYFGSGPLPKAGTKNRENWIKYAKEVVKKYALIVRSAIQQMLRRGAEEDLVGRMDQRYRDQDAMSQDSEPKTAARVSRGSDGGVLLTPRSRPGSCWSGGTPRSRNLCVCDWL